MSAGTANGFVFAEASPPALLHTIDRALSYWSDRATWRKLIATGMSNKEISSALDLSEKTIKNHVSRIFEKLSITSRTQAVVHAIKTGIA